MYIPTPFSREFLLFFNQTKQGESTVGRSLAALQARQWREVATNCRLPEKARDINQEEN